MAPQSDRRSRLLRPAWAAAAAASCLLLGGIVPSATAGSTPPSPFVIDGTVPDGVLTLADPSGSIQELGPLNSTATKLGVINRAAPPMLGLTNPNGQVDLAAAGVATKRDGDGDVWLYFAWKRDANRGSGVIMYEFDQLGRPAACDYSLSATTLTGTCNPWANRKAGDFILAWDQTGGAKTIVLRTFQGTGRNLTLGAPVTLDSTVSAANYSIDGYRGEAAVNLSRTVFAGSSSCTSYTNVIPGTVTGNSDSADFKDTILTTTDPISNCGTLKIYKKVVDGPSAASDFAVSVTKSSTNVASAQPFGAADDVAPTGYTGLVTVSNLLPGSYTVTEDANSLHYTATYGNDQSATDCTGLTVAAGDVVECRITNTYDKASPSGTTTQSWVLHDTLNVSGLRDGAGDAASTAVTFRLYSGTTCADADLVDTEEVDGAIPNNGKVSTSYGVEVTAAGTYSWRVHYSGDAKNNSFTTACGSEVTVISESVPTPA